MNFLKNLFKKKTEEEKETLKIDSVNFVFEYKVDEDIQRIYNVSEINYYQFSSKDFLEFIDKINFKYRKHYYYPLYLCENNNANNEQTRIFVQDFKYAYKNKALDYIETHPHKIEQFKSCLINSPSDKMLKFHFNILNKDKISFEKEEYIHHVKPIKTIEEFMIVFVFTKYYNACIRNYCNNKFMDDIKGSRKKSIEDEIESLKNRVKILEETLQ